MYFVRFTALFFLLFLDACVDPYTPGGRDTVDVVVVDGLLTDLTEKPFVRLNRSRADPINGRFGTLPLTNATLELVVDGTQIIPFIETAKGYYELGPAFRGQVGHRYQLRFRLDTGVEYASSEETMLAGPPIERLYQTFEPQSIPALNPVRFLPANEFFINTTDPESAANYYRWEWTLWEKQAYCHSCYQGRYRIYDYANRLLEDCVADFTVRENLDYRCRTPCWEIIKNTTLDLFADNFTNGRPINGKRVARIPYLHYGPCLVEIRQSALTRDAYQYFRLLEKQTQDAGTLADSPPIAPIGNVRNRANEREAVVGYFVVSSVSAVRYWLNRSGNSGLAIADSLFDALNARPVNEDNTVTAPCILSDTRTPFRPEGWRD